MTEDIARATIKASVEAQQRLLEGRLAAGIAFAGDRIAACFKADGKLLVFGNGGSAAIATQIASVFAGRLTANRRAVPAISLSDNASAITAIANDFAFDRIFSRQVEGLGRTGDIALGISTSGSAANVIDALKSARKKGLTTIGLTGGTGGGMVSECNVCLVAPSDEAPRIQECHTLIAHILCDLVERTL